MKDLIQKIEQTARDTDFSGVITIFQENRYLYNTAFGYRDIPNKQSNTTETKFGTASGTKLFTALGIGKLIDGGKLSLTTKVKELDIELNTFIDGNATIQNLLTHTSGIYDYYDEEIIEDFDNYFVEIPWNHLETPSDYLPLFKNKKMKCKPGQKYTYSNGGYVFLGIIIERITGLLYRDFIKDNVLDPVGMKNSGFYAFNELPANTATGYQKDRRTSNIYNLPIRGGGDGGMFTTTEDLQSFWPQLLSCKILSRELTEEYLKIHYSFDEKFGYGCGIYKKTDDSLFSIVGGDAGVGFYSAYIPSDKTVINILSNKTDGEMHVKKSILEMIENKG